MRYARQRGEPASASIVARRGRCRRSSTRVGEFIGKDVAVVRKTVAELGSDLGLLDDVDRCGTRAMKCGRICDRTHPAEAYC